MENFIYSSVERQEYGENITVTIDLIRHAEKAGANAPLTTQGELDAAEYGSNFNREFPDSSGVKIYHSGMTRAEQTAEHIKEGAVSPYAIRKQPALMVHGEFSEQFMRDYESRVTDAGDEAPAVQWYLDSNENRPDAETVSSREASEIIAREINHLVDLSARLKNSSQVHIVLVSHSGVVENFLVDALADGQREGFIQEVGGGLKYLEGARLIINRTDKNNAQVVLRFRDQEVSLSAERLKEIAGLIQAKRVDPTGVE